MRLGCLRVEQRRGEAGLLGRLMMSAMVVLGGMLVVDHTYAAQSDVTNPNYDEEAVQAFTLPNILEGPDGVAAATAKEWEQTSRPYQLRQLQRFVYGEPLPAVPVSVVGAVERKEVTLAGPGDASTPAVRLQAKLKLGTAANARVTDVLVYLPADASGPAPTFLKLNFAGNQAETPDADVWITPS
ncbi:MAG: hypothetical protein ACO3NZ_09340, partial [Pirellulales bacterium]